VFHIFNPAGIALTAFLNRTPDTEPLPVSLPSTPSPQSSIAIINTSNNKQLSQSFNNSTSGKSSLTIGVSSQSNSFNLQNKTSRYLKIIKLNQFEFVFI